MDAQRRTRAGQVNQGESQFSPGPTGSPTGGVWPRTTQGSREYMEKFFHLKENGTTVSTEILAGLTTFFAM
ncbi:hypothetical protein, partial [Bifidobacterium breve]|uniref:hypothetical protein n=1 Tax=Bifidobacterium breve TaxID=1685 RepID=UPI002164795C